MRRSKNSEGYVLYYLIGNRTIGLAKVKTVWYVMLRALRENVHRAFNNKRMVKPLSEWIAPTKTRFEQIQKWLGFCYGCLDKWKVSGGLKLIYVLSLFA